MKDHARMSLKNIRTKVTHIVLSRIEQRRKKKSPLTTQYLCQKHQTDLLILHDIDHLIHI